jgi:hypothetical protein
MNESSSSGSEQWFPVHPWFLPILRIIGGLGLCVFLWTFAGALRSSSANHGGFLVQQLPPLLLPLWLLGIQTTRRPRTLWNQTVTVLHWALIVVTALVCVVLFLRTAAFMGFLFRHP